METATKKSLLIICGRGGKGYKGVIYIYGIPVLLKIERCSIILYKEGGFAKDLYFTFPLAT